MRISRIWHIWFLLEIVVLFFPLMVLSQDNNEQRIRELERKVVSVESDLKGISTGGALAFLFGAFCALWAQYTRRNAWLWFFLGICFHVITVIVLLYKNAHTLHHEEQLQRRKEKLRSLEEEYENALRSIHQQAHPNHTQQPGASPSDGVKKNAYDLP
jgi:hypothetical protein